MQVKALKTFQNKIHGVQPTGLVRAGLVLTVPDRIGHQWIRSKLAAPFNVDDVVAQRKMTPGPDDNKNLGDAPEQKDDDVVNGEDEMNESLEENDEGNDDEEEETPDPSSAAGRRAGGKAVRSSALRPGRRSRRKI